MEHVFAHPCSLWRCSQWKRGGINRNGRLLMTGKESVVYTHNEILFGLKQEEKFATCDNVDESRGHYAK